MKESRIKAILRELGKKPYACRDEGGSLVSEYMIDAEVEERLPKGPRGQIGTGLSRSTARSALEESAAEWEAAAAKDSKRMPLPAKVRRAVTDLRNRYEIQGGGHEIRLIVLEAIEWVAASLLPPPAPVPLPVLRGKRPTRDNPVPAVESDIVVVIEDKKGKRLGGATGMIEGPYDREGVRTARRRIKSDAHGIIRVEGLDPGRYILDVREDKIEVMVLAPSPDALP